MGVTDIVILSLMAGAVAFLLVVLALAWLRRSVGGWW